MELEEASEREGGDGGRSETGLSGLVFESSGGAFGAATTSGAEGPHPIHPSLHVSRHLEAHTRHARRGN